jgi:hypothetical protein
LSIDFKHYLLIIAFGLLIDLSNDGLLPHEVLEDFSAGQPLDSSSDDESDSDVNESDSEEGEDDDGDDLLVYVADENLEDDRAPGGEE